MGQSARFELQYLTTNEAVPVELDGVMAARLADIRAALQDLAAGRFLDQPMSRESCPLCPHYFVCPALPS